MTVPANDLELPYSNRDMISQLYDEIIRQQGYEVARRVELSETVTAGNASRCAVVNMQWFGARSKLLLLYSLWEQFTGEEFIP